MELFIFFFTFILSAIFLKLLSNKLNWKFSWLLPAVMGFVIATIVILSISLQADQKLQSQPDPSLNINNQPGELTENEAYNFAQDLYKKIEDDEKFLEDAFELKEYDTISKYVLTDWPEYANRPHRFYPKAPVSYGHKYFPESDTVAPYTACDTAFIDLSILAGSMMRLVQEDTATLRKIYRMEHEDFLKSKAQCKERVNMTYEQALAADESE